MARQGEWADPDVAALGAAGYRDVRPYPSEEAGRALLIALSALLPRLAGSLVPVAELTLQGRLHVAYRSPSGLLIGGPPEPRPALSEEWETLDWRIPTSLAALYAVHDGLGPADGPRAQWRRDAVLPAGDLFPLTQRMRFGEENILYRPADLLLFAPDGRGGGHCFARTDPDEADPPTRAWDVQTRALGPPAPFAEVLAGLEGRWLTG